MTKMQTFAKKFEEAHPELKEMIINADDEVYDAYRKHLISKAKSINDVIQITSVIAVMNGWRANN